MTLHYEITEEDLFRWYQYSFNASPTSRTARRRHVLFWLAVYFCLASAAVLAFQTCTAALVGYGLAVIFTFTTRLVYNGRIQDALKAQAAGPLVKGSLGQAELTLSELGIREVTVAADSTLRWQAVVDAVQDGDHIFVRLSTGQAAVISRRSYSGPVAFEHLPELICGFKQKHGAAAPKVDPAASCGSSAATEGPPSVS